MIVGVVDISQEGTVGFKFHWKILIAIAVALTTKNDIYVIDKLEFFIYPLYRLLLKYQTNKS